MLPFQKICIIVAIAVFGVFSSSAGVSAGNNADVADCHIESFSSAINALTDASILVKEEILADCGDAAGKHGIFRVVPTRVKTQSGAWDMPVELVSITDGNGNPRIFAAETDSLDHTVSWKIGDPEIEITGKQTYIVTYAVANAVRAGQDFDELYWNLLGNYWDMEIDGFSSRITFPEGINEDNSQVDIYSGDHGESGNTGATPHWVNGRALEINSTQKIAPRQGVTVSVAFPAGIINAYRPGFLELYGNYLWGIAPLLALIIAFIIWLKHGKDPVLGKTIIPEFDIPENLTPIQLGMLEDDGVFSDRLLPAALVDLAVKKIISIEEIKKTWALGKNDYRLNLVAPPTQTKKLAEPEATLVSCIFKNGEKISLSELQNDFYLAIPKIRKAAVNKLIADGYICADGLSFKKIFMAVGFVIAWSAIFFTGSGWAAIVSLAGAGVIFIGFAFVMPKRTAKGAQTDWQTKGFKLYMKTAEKYRQQFNEKENIFEKFLPYAMVFGIAKLWIKKMETIYGKEYFSSYHPGWYSGIGAANFNANGFTSQISSMSASIAANTGTVSGFHGSGSVGGGGGGGGGGSW